MTDIKDNPLKEYENQINNLDTLITQTKFPKNLTEIEKIYLELRILVKKLKTKS